MNNTVDSTRSGPVTVLVVGGAGYIGSHMCKLLAEKGHQVVVLDNLSTGHEDALRYGQCIIGDVGDRDCLDAIFTQHRVDCVMHFASFIEVGESVREPAKYYRNNFSNTQVLLDAMRAHGVDQFVFSSTAAVFGEPETVPIPDDAPTRPINPYGRSKHMVEQLLADYESAYGLRSVALRYFNAAGADPDGELGERHEPETHLIPLVIQAVTGQRDHIAIFGTDYDTRDGTAVRDYIHVSDLCEAHLRAMEYLGRGGSSRRFNLGNGQGFSVREVIDTVRRVTDRNFTVREEPRRPGDPETLVADASGAHDVLGWQAIRNDLDTIVADAWRFFKQYSAKSGKE